MSLNLEATPSLLDPWRALPGFHMDPLFAMPEDDEDEDMDEDEDEEDEDEDEDEDDGDEDEDEDDEE